MKFVLGHSQHWKIIPKNSTGTSISTNSAIVTLDNQPYTLSKVLRGTISLEDAENCSHCVRGLSWVTRTMFLIKICVTNGIQFSFWWWRCRWRDMIRIHRTATKWTLWLDYCFQGSKLTLNLNTETICMNKCHCMWEISIHYSFIFHF